MQILKKIFFGFVLAVYYTLSYGTSLNLQKDDIYENFSALLVNETEDIDFRIHRTDRQSPYSIIAIHGGRIEIITSELAFAIAGRDYNFYTFEGIKPSKNKTLHVTSTHFDEPKAIDLVNKSDFVLSIHGLKNDRMDLICIGGLNSDMAIKIKNIIDQNGLLDWKTEYPCKKYPALQENNIVNRSKQHGVQLELSYKLRKELADDPLKFLLFVNLIRNALSHPAA